MKTRINGFHGNAKGNESMQTILIMAIGALLLLGLNKFFNGSDVAGKIYSNVTSILTSGYTIGGGTGGQGGGSAAP